MSNQAAFNLLSNQSISPASHVVSEAIPVNRSSGYFAVSGTLSGTSPAVTIEYLTGNGSNFVAAGNPIVSSLSTSPFHIQFYPALAESLKIKVTNQSESPVNVSLTLRFTEI